MGLSLGTVAANGSTGHFTKRFFGKNKPAIRGRRGGPFGKNAGRKPAFAGVTGSRGGAAGVEIRIERAQKNGFLTGGFSPSGNGLPALNLPAGASGSDLFAAPIQQEMEVARQQSVLQQKTVEPRIFTRLFQPEHPA